MGFRVVQELLRTEDSLRRNATGKSNRELRAEAAGTVGGVHVDPLGASMRSSHLASDA
jgi:hypothetical protein